MQVSRAHITWASLAMCSLRQVIATTYDIGPLTASIDGTGQSNRDCRAVGGAGKRY